MALKNLLLFLIVSGLDAICILLGSFVGHSINSIGLFAGAIIGGIVGVAAAVWLAARLHLLDRASYGATFVGGLIGFVAAVIAVKNLREPVIPMATVGLIGLGAILGKIVSVPRVHWVTRRYRLSDFDEDKLNANVKAWVRERGFSVYAFPKFDLFKRYWSNSYTIGRSWTSLLTKLTIALYVGYRAPFLYVFSTSHLPSELSNIFDEVFVPYAHRKGGELIPETPLAFSTSFLMSSPLSYFQSLKVDYRLKVQLEPQLERIEAATEEIRVPVGVNVTVKRSRTIKHAVEITRSETEGSEVEAGLKLPQLELLSATIKSEVQSQAGRRFEETETIEYEVSLSGDKSEAYRLTWADLVRVGVVEIHEAGNTTVLPFRCRERTELDVVPV